MVGDDGGVCSCYGCCGWLVCLCVFFGVSCGGYCGKCVFGWCM